MPAIAGLRGTGDWGTDERPRNFRETILWRQPNGTAPLTALLSKMKSASTDDPEFNWWEEQMGATRVVTTAAGFAAGVTTIALGAAGGGLDLLPGDLLLVEKLETVGEAVAYDNEIVEVTSITNDTTIVVQRGAAGTTAAAIPAAATGLTKIGNVFAEGTNSPSATTRNPTKQNNVCQIFKTTYELTETAKRTTARTGDPLKNDKKRKMFDHSAALEYAFLFGRRHETAGANGKPKRYTGGLRSFLTSNVKIFDPAASTGTSNLTETNFVDFIYRVFNYNSGAGDERLILCGNGALNTLNRMARDNPSTCLNFAEIVKIWGMNLQKWVLPQGTFYMKTHPLMNLHPQFKDSMFILDPTALRYRHMRDTGFKDNIQANDADSQKGQWLTEAGLEVNHEMTMGYIGRFSK